MTRSSRWDRRQPKATLPEPPLADDVYDPAKIAEARTREIATSIQMQLEWLSRSDALRVLHAVVLATKARRADRAIR